MTFSSGSRLSTTNVVEIEGVWTVDVCRTIIVAMASLALLQMSARLSYGADGWRLAATSATTIYA